MNLWLLFGQPRRYSVLFCLGYLSLIISAISFHTHKYRFLQKYWSLLILRKKIRVVWPMVLVPEARHLFGKFIWYHRLENKMHIFTFTRKNFKTEIHVDTWVRGKFCISQYFFQRQCAFATTRINHFSASQCSVKERKKAICVLR